MILVWQTWACVWREVWLQRACRHYLATLLEIGLVALMFKDIASERPTLLPGTRHSEHEMSQHKADVVTDQEFLNRRARLVTYWPSSNSTDTLVAAAFPYATYGNHSTWRLAPAATKQAVLDMCSEETFGGAPEEWTDIRRQSIVVCLLFSEPKTVSSLNYTVVVVANYIPSAGYIWQQSEGPWRGLLSVPRYLQYVQDKLDRAHIRLIQKAQRNSSKYNYEGFSERFPGPVLPEDIPSYRNKVIRTIALAYALPFCIRISTISWEKSSGLKMKMSVMGLHDLAYWLSHWCSSVLLGCITSAIVVVMMFTLVVPGDEEELSLQQTAYLEGANPALVSFAFFVFCCSYSTHALFVAALCRDMTLALVMGAAYWFVAMTFVPWLNAVKFQASLADYIYMSRKSKLLSSISPVMGLFWVLKIAGISADIEDRREFGLIFHRVLGLDNVAIVEIWAVTLSTCLCLVVLMWYATRVIPSATTLPLPYSFPFQVSYWVPKMEPIQKEKTTKEEENIEKDPQNAQPVIVVDGVKKRTPEIMHLDGINYKLFNGDIGVILGSRSGGKSALLDIIMGLDLPTEGEVRLCGYDVTKYPFNARLNVGYCSYKDIFFNDLTVLEHLEFYAMLKGVSSSELKSRALLLLELMELLGSLTAFPGALSSGMKRRLSVAMATISSPKVLVLDEPTQGNESEYRWDMWEMLIKMREECSILVATSEVEEAMMLGTRITILSQGRLVCSGSTDFVKGFCGTGYQIRILKEKGQINVDYVLTLVRLTVPNATVARHTWNELTIDLKTTDSTGFQHMFSVLEHRRAQLNIDSIRLVKWTLEDYYNKMNKGTVDTSDPLQIIKTKDPDYEGATKLPPLEQNITQQISVLLFKRRLHYQRCPTLPLLGVVVPFLIFWGQIQLESMTLSAVEYSGRISKPPLFVNLSLSQLYPGASVFVGYDNQTLPFMKDFYIPLLDAESAHAVVIGDKDPDEYLIEMENKEGLVQYTVSSLCGALIRAELNATTSNAAMRLRATSQRLQRSTQDIYWIVEAWWNPYMTLSQALSTNLINSALLQYYSNDVRARISTEILGFHSIDTDIRHHFEFMMDRAGVGYPRILRIMILPLGVSLLVASFVLFPMWDAVSRSKTLQLMTGLHGSVYWAANLMFDLIAYSITGFLLISLYFWYYYLAPETKLYMLLTVVAFAGVAINLGYLVTFLVKIPTMAYAIVVVFFFFGGMMTIFPYLLFLHDWLQSGDPPLWVRLPMVLLPSFSFPWAFIKLLQIDKENQHCAKYAQLRQRDVMYLEVICSDPYMKSSTSLALRHCCNEFYLANNGTDLTPLDAFNFSESGIALEILAMFLEGFVLFAAVCWMDFVTPWKCVLSTKPPQGDAEIEVMKEGDVVNGLCDQMNFKGYNIVVRDVHKSYGQIQALSRFTCAIKTNEIFGILGKDGAGKTTTCQILTGCEQPMKGDAYTNNITLCHNPGQWRQRIGYCMQEGGLLNHLTGYENLTLFARLRGIPDGAVPRVINCVLRLLGLQPLAQVKCLNFSEGNKRKLSLGCAIIGMPELLILDDPFLDIDLAARKSIRSCLHVLTKSPGVSIIVTSDSFSDCSLICDRMTVLVEGEMRCLGTLQQLEKKYAQGYSISFGLGLEHHRSTVADAIMKAFPGIRFLEFFKGFLEYRLEEKMLLSDIFRRIDDLRSRFHFEKVTVSESILERVFQRQSKRKPPVRTRGLMSRRVSLFQSSLGSNRSSTSTTLPNIALDPAKNKPPMSP
ncbi:phospholipid-transporting ATPase ABCA3-like isoform X2 [Ornithodoros turicata]|uniref:phospholipid-transporting ATPase ABCA3-like isoform X2 n=1 Tax=Ornithodoros turicata TaxID=34597 RepID=UPI003139DB96